VLTCALKEIQELSEPPLRPKGEHKRLHLLAPPSALPVESTLFKAPVPMENPRTVDLVKAALDTATFRSMGPFPVSVPRQEMNQERPRDLLRLLLWNLL